MQQLTRRGFLAQNVRIGAAGLLAAPFASPAAASPQKAGDPGWRIGCYTRPWDQHDYRVALDAIAEAGFKYAGLLTSKSGLVLSAATTPKAAAKVGEEARKRGLTILSVYGGNIPVDKSLGAGVADMRRLIDNCAAAQAESLLMGGVTDRKLHERYYQAIAVTVDYASSKRVEISLKPHGGTNATGAECREAIRMVGHKNFRLWYDPGNIYYYSDGKLDPVKDALAVDGIVTGVCIKDYKHPKNVLVTPGDGMVDFPAVLTRLKKGGLTHGPLVVETLARGDPAELLKEAKRARAFLERLVA